MTVDFSKFNWKEIFGTVKQVQGLKRNQTRPLRTEIIELAIEKYSNKQLRYVGDVENGKDFIGSDGLRYECKCKEKMFQKDKMSTEIVLRNFQGNNTGIPEKTFDVMILIDTGTNSASICSWEDCIENVSIKSSGVCFRVHKDKVKFIAENVAPKNKTCLSEKLRNVILESI